MFIDHRYEVLESLGSGTWANVYKVRDIRTGGLFTLKLFQYLSSEDIYARFSAEDMHHITKIEHPNLAQVVDFGHVGDHIYFISDYFEGNTLNSFRFGKTKIGALYEIVVQICYALHALHTQNIIHKDLKLENILYKTDSKQTIVKLIDYGFSKVDVKSTSQMISGTLPYVAPEVYMGKEVGFASDFYSLGVILYRIITRTFPFNLEQINTLISGSQQYFIPIFPSESNKDIPLSLEKLVLRLLERNPDNRFQSSQEIIAYINRATERQYPFSLSWSMVNTMRFNSYIVRENYSHQILDHLPSVQQSNGKIISLMGGDGLGKDNILTLFRYHLLGGEYFIYDYACTRTDHEAFFALIKEYIQSFSPEEINEYVSLQNISDKFKSYLFASEKEAKTLTQTQEELRIDFDSVKSLLIDLSIRKPIIFIIRNFQYVNRHTIDFINYLSPFLVRNRIMVVLSCNEFNKINQIEHTILVHIPMLSTEQTLAYMKRLVHESVPESFATIVHHRSAGNPQFVREIIVDLTLKNKIKRVDGELIFPDTLAGYAIPSRILHSVYSRMSHITAANYAHLQKLSVVQTPLSRELILSILKLSDSDLYNLLGDATYNEILVKCGKHYYFTFPEAKLRFFEETAVKVHILVSKRVIRYYKTKTVTDIETCRGIIANSEIAGDLVCKRLFCLRLYQLLSEENHHEAAYEAILSALKIDFEPAAGIDMKDVILDLICFQEKTEITGFFKEADFIIDHRDSIPELFEKYYVLGTLKLLAEDTGNALELFKQAEKLALTGRQRVQGYLSLAQVYNRIDSKQMKLCLDKIDPHQLSLDLKIAYIDRLAVYHSLNKDNDKAIKIIEDFLAEIPPGHDTRVMLRLAAIHNDLGVFYSDQKNISEAAEHLNLALGLWKRHNINRYLGLIYNNMADLYLKQGITVVAMEYAKQAHHYAAKLNLTIIQSLALLNQGEAKIKMGDFTGAEIKLNEAGVLVRSVGSTRYLDAIQRNLALAKSKIIGFGYYLSFIKENEPQLLEGYVPEINPLVKTYFYYLNEMSNPQKLRRLVRKNVHINYSHIHEEEFYHNVLSLLAYSEKDYETALSELKLAMRYAGEISNNYAIAVFYTMQVFCHYGMGDYQKARELVETARPIIAENEYRYWQMKLDIISLMLDLVDEEIPLRGILREVNRRLELCGEYHYYQLAVELMQMKVQILLVMNAELNALEEYERYQAFLDKVTADICEDDRTNYIAVNLGNLKTLKKFELVRIVSRSKDMRNKWNELLYNIANLNSVERIRFLIEKGICQVISPWQFKLMVYSEKISNYYCFHSYNCAQDSLITPEYLPYVERAFDADNLVVFTFHHQHTMIIPLVSGTRRIGFIIVNDSGELEFTRSEMSIIRSGRQHIAALIIRINDYSEITLRIAKMNQLMKISNELMRNVDILDLEREIVSAAIDFTNATRGFLIKKDAEGNNLYQVQMDHQKQILSNVSGISKTALSMSQTSQSAVSTFNALEDKSFKSSISVQEYAIHTIYSCPIRVDMIVYGYLYLDNLGENTREMYLNDEIIDLFQKQVEISIKNALHYAAILKKGSELNEIESIKDEFMAIVSHELNTPLTTLQGYVSRLKRKLYSDDEERQEIVGKIESSVKKLILSSGDISTMNYYNLAKDLVKAPIEITEIIDLVHQEVEILSRKRNMFIKMEIEAKLPKIMANWEAIHRMIHNVVLNAIRFTNNFGNITIGVRRSVFPQEKIDNKESLVIFVQDNGIGIPEFQIKNIFRKFYELNDIYAHKSGTVEYRSSGLGLGLSTAKRIAELHGGSISIKSKENEGTSVFLILPFKH
ncbi:MAG: protein kinase [Candidatus Cloacimonadaceae bacterium]|nr:protein kinase [Candidatus Cloacimonadaceae bacterium]